MSFFITGTDTDVGKSLISAWLCLQSGYSYFKPIQTGTELGSDSKLVKNYADVKIYPEIYRYKAPLSPHLAAAKEQSVIDLNIITLPQDNKLLVEGAGGLMVPINEQYYMIDLIAQLGLPVILVARSSLGTINHSLLSIEALRVRNINIAGIILNGQINEENKHAIENYGKISILAQFPHLASLSKAALLNIPLSENLKNLLK